MKALKLFCLLTLIMTTPSSFGGLKIFYDPTTDLIDHLEQKGIHREPDYKHHIDQELSPGDNSLDTLGYGGAVKLLEEKVIDELWHKSKALSTLLKPQDKIVFLGRSPSGLGLVFRNWQQLNGINTENLISLAFSGTPDMVNIRPSSRDDVAPRNLVTRENLKFYESYLQSKGLDQISADGKLYIVDIIGTGSSLNSFFRILVHFYSIVLKKPIPDIYFICLTISDGEKIEYRHSITQEKIWKFGPTQKKLAFAELPTYGFRQMTVDTIPLGISGVTIGAFDLPANQYFFATEPAFPAYLWHKTPSKTEAQKVTLSIFNNVMTAILNDAFEQNKTPLGIFQSLPKE